MSNYYNPSLNPNAGIGTFEIITGIVLVLLITILGWYFWKKYNQKKSLNLFLKHRKIPDVMKDLSPESFELWVQGLFINLGADAVLSKREKVTGFDHGIDLVVNYNKQKICVQCKKYYPGNLVSETVLRGTYGAKFRHNYNKAIIVTTSNFTKRSIEWATGVNDLILINGELLQKIRENKQILVNLLK